MEQHRVVVTGLGVCAPNGVGVTAFKEAIENGKSGIRFYSELEKLKFSCQHASGFAGFYTLVSH